jgi:tetratricopeptide (TPR) repeat protein
LAPCVSVARRHPRPAAAYCHRSIDRTAQCCNLAERTGVVTTPSVSPERPMFEALRLHRQGRLEQAVPLYREVLAAAPRDAEALHMLGIVALQQRRFDEADRLIAEALSISPDSAEALSNRATALRALAIWRTHWPAMTRR